MQYKDKLFLNKYLYQRKLIVLSKNEIKVEFFLTLSAFHKTTFYYRSIYYARILLLNPMLEWDSANVLSRSNGELPAHSYVQLMSHPVNDCCCLGVFVIMTQY